MSLIKRLKNNSGNKKTILNFSEIDNQSYITLPYRLWVKVLDTSEVLEDVQNSIIIVNDGTSDLSPIEGLNHLKKFQEINSGDDNFSYHKIASGETIKIPVNQQMIVCDNIEIEGILTLEDNAELVLI